MAQSQTFTATGIASAALNASNADVSNYGSFAGTDITVHINHVLVGTLMGVSYTIHTEKQAQYTFGSRDVRKFTTGKRGIAGTLVFNTFDRNALIAVFGGSNLSQEPMANLYANSQALGGNNPFTGRYGELGNSIPFTNPLGSLTYSALSSSQNGATSTDTSAFNADLQTDFQDAYAAAFSVPLNYADQLPPFDVILTMVDNQGNGAFMVIGGVEVMNEGGGFTVDDLTNQTAYTYVAKYVRPLSPIGPNGSAANSAYVIG